MLAACFAAVHARHPGLLIEAVVNVAGNLSARFEPDVAVCLRRFEQADLVVRNIGTVAFGLYGCVAYLERHGEPDLGNRCAGHQLITLSDERELSDQAGWLAGYANRARVALRADR